MNAALAYASAALLTLWGTAHVIPTGQVLAGFRPVTPDNRRIVQQEWLAEAFTMWGLAAVIVAATAASGASDSRTWVYRAAAALLIALATLTAFTGARTAVIWFKVCPVLLTAAAALLVTASF
jgi:hypothetical protein